VSIDIIPIEKRIALDRPIKVEINASTDASFNAGFRAAEEFIYSRYGLADLVQLSGYYQYEPKISIRIDITNVQNSESQKLFLFLNKLITARMLAKPLQINEFAQTLGISKKELLEILFRLKKLGFEVRNSNTNPQIQPDVFIIPYAFPTLTPVSVQLRKEL